MANQPTPRQNRVKKLREEHGWSQKELGKKIGAIKETIYKIESGHQGITEAQQFALSEVFNVTIENLYENAARLDTSSDEAIPFTPSIADIAAGFPLHESLRWYRIVKSRSFG